MKTPILFIASVLLAVTVQANTIEGFTGPYAESEWTIELPDADYITNAGGVTFTGTTTLIIEGPDGDSCSGGAEVVASVVIHQSGQISFDYNIVNNDADGAGYDFFIVRRSVSGVQEPPLVSLSVHGTVGNFSHGFETGDILELVVFSRDCIEGELTVTITNFSHTTFLVPLTSHSVYLLMFLIGGFLIFRLRQL